MNRKKVDKLLLKMSIGAFFLMSISFLLMPFDFLKIAAGILFWFGLVLGALLQFILEARRKSFFSQYRVKRKDIQKPRNGLLSFGANRYACTVDCILLICIPCLIAAFLLTRGTSVFCYIFISLTVFSFCMHCVFNGRIYVYVNNQIKIRHALEDKKIRTFRKGAGEK